MVPSDGSGGILPEKPHFVFVVFVATLIFFLLGKMELVASEIGTEVQLVLFAKVEVEFSVQVEKIVAGCRAFCNTFHDGHHDQVEVSGASGKHEGSFVFDNRAFHHHVRRYKSDATLAMVALLVAVFHVDVDDRREPSAVTGRESAFYKFNGLDGIPIEDGEEA